MAVSLGRFIPLVATSLQLAPRPVSRRPLLGRAEVAPVPCHVWKGPQADFTTRSTRTRSHAFCLASGKQIAAAEIVDCQHDALEAVRPVPGRNADVGPNDGHRHLD